MQMDPAGYVDGADLYQFVESSPAKNVDPMGLDADVAVKGGIVTWLNASRFRADMHFVDQRFPSGDIGNHKHIYTHIDARWSVADTRADSSIDGYYRYYLKGVVDPKFDFSLARQHAQWNSPDRAHRMSKAQEEAAAQYMQENGSAADTDGSLLVTFTYVSFCKDLLGFQDKMNPSEQGQPTEQNSNKGNPNRFFVENYRAAHSWAEAMPDGWTDGLVVYQVTLAFEWTAAPDFSKAAGTETLNWKADVTREEPLVPSMSVNSYSGSSSSTQPYPDL
jgi:hypothetical protein